MLKYVNILFFYGYLLLNHSVLNSSCWLPSFSCQKLFTHSFAYFLRQSIRHIYTLNINYLRQSEPYDQILNLFMKRHQKNEIPFNIYQKIQSISRHHWRMKFSFKSN